MNFDLKKNAMMLIRLLSNENLISNGNLISDLVENNTLFLLFPLQPSTAAD